MRSSRFVVPVVSILRSREPRRELFAGVLDDLFVTGSSVPLGAQVTVDVVLEPLGAAIEAIGTVAAPWVGECRRCLKPVDSRLVVHVREIFEERPVEEETYLLANGQIDLEPMAREAVVLELPQAPLCREDCQGLCTVCGTDLNEGVCSCEPAIDPRWAGLEQLRIDD